MLKNRSQELDSLRGIAALSVAFFHYTSNRAEANWGFKYGGTAVDLFFMISGFVIFLSVINNPSWKNFLRKRVARLYPAYWICVIITTLVIVLNHYFLKDAHNLLMRFLANLTMFQYYFKVLNIDDPYWTLAIELMFYILIGCIMVIKALNKIEIIGYFILFLMIALDFYIFPYHPQAYKHINAALPLINHWPMFFAGILFYKQKKKETLSRYVSIVICFIFSVLIFKYASSVNSISIFEYFIIVFIYFLTFLLLIKNRLQFLKVKTLLFLGNISYPFYLIHQYVGRDFLMRNLMTNYNIGFWLSCFIALAFSITLSSIITYYLEPVIKNRLNKYLFGKEH